MKCPNCGKVLTCGCQKVKAADGRMCCNSCASYYNASLKKKTNSGISNVNATVLKKRVLIDSL